MNRLLLIPLALLSGCASKPATLPGIAACAGHHWEMRSQGTDWHCHQDGTREEPGRIWCIPHPGFGE